MPLFGSRTHSVAWHPAACLCYSNAARHISIAAQTPAFLSWPNFLLFTSIRFERNLKVGTRWADKGGGALRHRGLTIATCWRQHRVTRKPHRLYNTMPPRTITHTNVNDFNYSASAHITNILLTYLLFTITITITYLLLTYYLLTITYLLATVFTITTKVLRQ